MFRSLLGKNFLTSRSLKSRKKALARLRSRKVFFESLEDRALLATLYVDNTPGMAGTEFTASGGTQPASVAGLTPGVDIFSTIQAAVTFASPLDTINVSDGTYTENVTVTKTLTLNGNQFGVDARGRAANETIVMPAAALTATINVAFNGTLSIDGFAFSGGPTGANGVIFTSVGPNNNMQIVNDRFSNFAAAAVWMNRSGADITIDRNVMDGSSLAGGGQVIFANGPQSYTGLNITNNDIINAPGRYGFFVDGNHNVGESATRAPSISGNTFNNLLQGMNLGSRSFGTLAAPVLGPYGGTISNNTFSNNAFDGIQGGIQHVLVSQNTFTNNGRSGITLTSFGNTGADRGAQNSVITENFFSGSVSEDVFFSSSQGAGLISTNTLVGNSLGSAKAVTYGGAELIRAGGNWWGSAANPEFTGTKISGAGAANVDYSPWLNSGVDTNLVTPGFQGDFSVLNVDDDSPISAQNGGVARIQEGINVVTVGGTVNVLAGTYNEFVAVNKTVALLGAQAGVDARTRVVPISSESVVSNGDGDFQILADNVTIDGFTLEGVTNNPSLFPFTGLGAAIWTNPGFSGTQGGHQIRNNIIQGNIVGVELDNTGVFPTVVEKNLFQNNNAPGPNGGIDIAVDFGLNNALIDNNKFTNTAFVVDSWALGVEATSNGITFSNNDVTNHGRGVFFYLTDGAIISGNTITGTSNYAIGIFNAFGPDNNANIDILNNVASGNNRFIFLDGYTGDLDVSGNSITGGNIVFDIADASGFANLNLTNNSSSGNTTGGTVDNVVTINLTTTNSPDTIDVDGDLSTFDTNVMQSVSYTNVTNLNAFGLAGNDTFNVKPAVTTNISIDGGAPTAVPVGDVLNYDALGLPTSFTPTTITSAGRATLNYTDIENLNITAAPIVVFGTAGDDVLTLSYVDATHIQYVLNGGPPVVLTSPSSFTFDGLAGDDEMIVDFTGGNPIPTGGVFYDGGAQNGTLPYPLGDMLFTKLAGNNATAAAGSTSGSGTVTVGGGVISYTGLEPVDMSGGGIVTVVGTPVTGTNDLWTVTNGLDSGTGTIDALVVTGTSGGGPAFESIHLWSNTTVVLDTTTVAGTDTVTVASGDNGHNNTNLTITTGGEAGDIVNFNGVLNLAGALIVSASGGTANVNAAINAASITGNLPVTNVDDAPSGQVQDGVDLTIAGGLVNVLAGTYPENVTVSKNLTVDGAVDGLGDPSSIITPAAGTAMTVTSPATVVTLRDLSLVAPGGGAALSATLGVVGTTLNLTNLNSSGAGSGGSVSNWNTINFTTNDNANTAFVTGVASSGLSTSPLAGKAANSIEVMGKLIPLGYATTVNGTLNVDVKNGDDTVAASPSTNTFINLLGGPHTAGDKLILDMSGTTPIVIVDSAGGKADSASTKTLTFAQFEILCVFDPVLTSTTINDFYVRGTDNADYIQFVSSSQFNPNFRLRVGNIYYPTNGGAYGPYTTSGPNASKMFVYGRGGADTISMYNTRLNAAFFGEAGDDVLTGGYGDDLLVGGAGADRINGATVGGNDEVWGDDFNPAVDNPSVASQTLLGGNDQINTFGGNDTVYGQAGADIINTGGGDDYVNGGAGADQIDGQGGNDRIYGGTENDVISGSDGNDLLAGNAGNDTLYGRLGNDILIGGINQDTLNGNEGSDALIGDESNGLGSNSLSKNDAVDAALLALLTAWGTTPVLGNLSGLNSSGPDGSIDTLWGGTGADAFFGFPPDTTPDRNAFGYGPDLN